MEFSQLFAIYYNLYRGDPETPTTADPEWKMAIRFYNNALLRMASMDDTKWNHLFQSLIASGDGDSTMVTGTSEYAAPDDMVEPGGQITFLDLNGNRTNYPVVQPHEAQGLSDMSTYGYFIGDQNNGFTLVLNPATDSNHSAWGLDYVYYRKPLLLEDDEDGDSIIEGGDPAFYYNHMLAQRFRASRNWPAYQTALRDAEEALKGMKLKNNSGNYYSAWKINDTYADSWGN